MTMTRILHITSGDSAGERLKKSGLDGEVFVWHDILYDGPRRPGWPDRETLQARSLFLEGVTGGGLKREEIRETLEHQYRVLQNAGKYDGLLLWFDACLFDQAMLCHILSCIPANLLEKTELICLDSFPGIVPFNGLGQLSPEQLASRYDRRRAVNGEQFRFAGQVDRALALRDHESLSSLARLERAPLPHVPAAVGRWLKEWPDEATGLGRLERLALEAIRSGCTTPAEVFAHVASRDEPPHYWGDITLWAKINALATRQPPMVTIEGPAPLLPQWNGQAPLAAFTLFPFSPQ